MNKPIADLKPEAEIEDPTVARLKMLREPFAAHHISKLPKEAKWQREEREKDRSKGVNCNVCGGWHHRNAVHLDYVGHAALTDRLLDVDPQWSWEPLALTEAGLPAFDKVGGLWIKLTVCGLTRLGYGNAPGKEGSDAIKEIIGDALRNAAMRFGAALELWHKGELHVDEPEAPAPSLEEKALALLRGASADRSLLKEAWEKNKDVWKKMLPRDAYARLVGEVTTLVEALPKDEPPPPPPPADDFGIGEDEIPF
jgi:hypothetical protein